MMSFNHEYNLDFRTALKEIKNGIFKTSHSTSLADFMLFTLATIQMRWIETVHSYTRPGTIVLSIHT